MGFRNCLEAGCIGFEPFQDLEYVDLNIIAQVLEQSIKLPLPNSTDMVGRMRSEKMEYNTFEKKLIDKHSAKRWTNFLALFLAHELSKTPLTPLTPPP